MIRLREKTRNFFGFLGFFWFFFGGFFLALWRGVNLNLNLNLNLNPRLQEGEELQGLHCFRDLGTHLSQAADSVNR